MASQKKRSTIEVMNSRAAGIDVGARFHVVAVSAELDPQPVRHFDTFTGDLHRLADWLIELGITTVAMESTGVYWIPVFEVLDQRGLEVLLVNARNVKSVPGRKTDTVSLRGTPGTWVGRTKPGRQNGQLAVTSGRAAFATMAASKLSFVP